MHKTKRTAGNREVLCEDGNRLTHNSTGTDNYTVTRQRFVLHAEITTVMLNKHIILLERVSIYQRNDTLTRGHFTHRFLFFDGFGSASETDTFFPLLEFENFTIL